ncbi:hypothetical protein MLD38_032276 [Melastoma candidum]|uniref:Uncharacterized protein n=1 Tax=Melastoma candidum TaxID=119954 RepID=A0ACB9M3E5_9MYRT|nr:hypothetical protein MLD38_032276 [Melastoma candidum]
MKGDHTAATSAPRSSGCRVVRLADGDVRNDPFPTEDADAPAAAAGVVVHLMDNIGARCDFKNVGPQRVRGFPRDNDGRLRLVLRSRRASFRPTSRWGSPRGRGITVP